MLMMIDSQKNTLKITDEEMQKIWSIISHPEQVLKIEKHSTLKELDTTVHEFVKSGGK